MQEFEADGGFVWVWGWGVNQAIGGEVCIKAAGDVCKAGSKGAASLFARKTCDGHPAVVSAGAFNAGDVVVVDSANRWVMEFERIAYRGGHVRSGVRLDLRLSLLRRARA